MTVLRNGGSTEAAFTLAQSDGLILELVGWPSTVSRSAQAKVIHFACVLRRFLITVHTVESKKCVSDILHDLKTVSYSINLHSKRFEAMNFAL